MRSRQFLRGQALDRPIPFAPFVLGHCAYSGFFLIIHVDDFQLLRSPVHQCLPRSSPTTWFFSRYRYSSTWALGHLGTWVTYPIIEHQSTVPFLAIIIMDLQSTVAYSGYIASQFASKSVAHRLFGAIPNTPGPEPTAPALRWSWTEKKSIGLPSSLSLNQSSLPLQPSSISISTPYILPPLP